MPNIASVLKEEITRLIRKELRNEIARARKISAAQRAEIAELKRQTKDLERSIRSLQKQVGQSAAPSSLKASQGQTRFSAKGLAAHRKRLGLSAADFGLLIGASSQSIYKWEEGRRPRAKQLAAIATLRALSKSEAAVRLEELKAA